MLRPGLIGMFATVQLLFCPYYLWEFSGLFSRVLHHECHLPLYIHRQCSVNNGYRPDSTAYYIIQTVAAYSLKKEIIEIITAQNSVGTPALFLAMMNRHTDNVKIFMQEIQSLVDNHIIHEDNLVKLLQTKSANETPGLYISMLYGFDEIIDIFLNALTTPIAQELLNKKLAMSILAMKIHDGEPRIIRRNGK